MSRRLVGIGSAVLVGGLLAVLPAGSAGADPNCPAGAGMYPHVYSYAQWCDGTAAAGVYTTMSNIPIYENDGNDFPYGEINNEFWVFTSNQNFGVYMETGIRNGYNLNNVEGYWLWWSDYNLGFHNHFIQKMAMNGNAYDWKIWYGNNGNWYAWTSYTNTTYALSTLQSGPYSWAWDLGMEEVDGGTAPVSPPDGDYLNSPSGSPAQIDPDEHSGGDFPNELWVSQFPNGPWHNPYDTVSAEVNYGCYYYPNGYCMTGTPYIAGGWAEGLPG